MAKYIVIVCAISVFASGQDPLCNDSMTLSLSDSHFDASSSRVDTNPARGRINTSEMILNNGTKLLGGWSPNYNKTGEYIQVLFHQMALVNGILIQGRNNGGGLVTSFKAEYTEDGKTWQTINNERGVEEIFMGNSNADDIQENSLSCPIFAMGIRIIPLEWINEMSLRTDVTGCYFDQFAITAATSMSTPTVLTTIFSTNATTTPPFLPGIVSPFGIRVNGFTSSPKNTVNILTLIQWFITHMNNSTSTAKSPTTSTVQASTTKPITKASSQPIKASVRSSEPQPMLTTTEYVFRPGIPDPFGLQPGQSLIG